MRRRGRRRRFWDDVTARIESTPSPFNGLKAGSTPSQGLKVSVLGRSLLVSRFGPRSPIVNGPEALKEDKRRMVTGLCCMVRVGIFN